MGRTLIGWALGALLIAIAVGGIISSVKGSFSGIGSATSFSAIGLVGLAAAPPIGIIHTSLGIVAEYAIHLRVPVLIAALLVTLPFIAFFTGARSLLRGLFDLTPLSLFVVALTTVAVAGAACMNASVILLHAHERFSMQSGPVSVPESWWIAAMLLLSLPVVIFGAAFSIRQKHPAMKSIFAALSGIGMALGFAWELILTGPKLTAILAGALHTLEGWLVRTGLFAGYADLSAGVQDPFVDHLLAGIAFASSLALYAAVGFYGYFQLGRRRTVPALCSALMLILMTGWMLSATTFFFDQWRIPTLLIVGIAGVLTAQSERSDHFYHLRRRSDSTSAPSPAATIAVTGSRRLIVAAANGGGIQAGAWAAQVLYGLSQDCGEQFDRSLRMISSVSGGSVGAAFFLHWLSKRAHARLPTKPPLSRVSTRLPGAWPGPISCERWSPGSSME
jgi:hypothetical protein